MGPYETARVLFQPAQEADNGSDPTVAANGNYAVQMHRSQDAESLWYSTALVIDHSRWMEDLRGVIGDTPLWKITFPGTHDACMYTSDCSILNDHADSTDPSTMQKDQLNKLEETNGGDEYRMFLLSWTLTASDSWEWWFKRIVRNPPVPPLSLHQMTTYAKPYLGPFLRTYSDKYPIGYVFTDYYNEVASPDLAIVMNQGLLTAPPGPPVLNILANGRTEGLLVTPETPVSLAINFDPGYRENLKGDQWISVETPMGWYSYVKSSGWQEGLIPCDQPVLTRFSPTMQIPGVALGKTGNYTYYFAVDDNADGHPDGSWKDSVTVDVSCWR